MPGPPVLIRVYVKQTLTSKLPGRPQRWRWVARNDGNHKVLARSSERYTNRADCLSAIDQLFGSNSNVYRREAEVGDVQLRLAS